MKTIGIDPGSSFSGICMIENGKILHASVTDNKDVLDLVNSIAAKSCRICIEDVVPYIGKLSPHTITTCKWIGELTYRLKENGFKKVSMIGRKDITYWLYNKLPEVCVPRVEKRMKGLHETRTKLNLKGLHTKKGVMRLPSFHYLDDRTVIAALKVLLNIPTPKPGKKNIYGLHSHSWSALAVAVYREHNPRAKPKKKLP